MSNRYSSYFYGKKALEEAGQELGYEVKIETHGAIGVENKLTKEDIKELNT